MRGRSGDRVRGEKKVRDRSNEGEVKVRSNEGKVEGEKISKLQWRKKRNRRKKSGKGERKRRVSGR